MDQNPMSLIQHLEALQPLRDSRLDFSSHLCSLSGCFVFDTFRTFSNIN
ncbi:hypothetical protein FDUTEX481_05321 [Tolypothrix sp. PCC 7601]|nr:hypothetical protein FDUTEX481_05321 [Tolypothrix sp. PCC 7601]